jgi:hypothetical protein
MNEQIERSRTPSQTESATIVYNPDGTKVININSALSVEIKWGLSLEYFDYSAYVQHLIWWTTLENLFKLIRDLHGLISMLTVAIFLMLLGLQTEKFPKPLPKL